LADALGESEHDRFKRFAKAILAVPKSEITSPEQTLLRLKAEKKGIESKIVDVRRVLAKQRSARRKQP
jgi:hypothetical protein